MKSKSSSPNPGHNYGPDLEEEEEEHDGSANCSDARRHGAKFPLSPHCLHKTPLLYSTAPSSPPPPFSPNPSHKYGYGPDLEEKKEHDGSANYSDAGRHDGKRRRISARDDERVLSRLHVREKESEEMEKFALSRLHHLRNNNNGLMEKFVFGGGLQHFKEEETQNPPDLEDEDEDNSLKKKVDEDEDEDDSLKKKVELFNSLLKKVEIGRGLPFQSPAAEAFFKKDVFKDIPQADTFLTPKEVSSMISDIFLRPRKKCVFSSSKAQEEKLAFS